MTVHDKRLAKSHDDVLEAMADALEKRSEVILQANELDLEDARQKKVKRSYLDRLMLDEGRIAIDAKTGVHQLAAHFAAQGGLGQAGADGLGHLGNRDRAIEVAFRAIGQRDLNHERAPSNGAGGACA